MNKLNSLCHKFYKLAQSSNSICVIEGCDDYGSLLVDNKRHCYKHGYYCKLCHQGFSNNPPAENYKGHQICPYCASKLEGCSDCGLKLKDKLLIEFTDGKKYCETCIPEGEIQCPSCDETTSTANIVEVGRDRINKSIGCESCCAKCNNCSNWVDEENSITSGIDREKYCEDCFSELFTHCDECSDTVEVDDCHFIEARGESICSSCYSNAYGECHECNEPIPKNNLTEAADGNEYCEDCLPEEEEESEDENTLPEAYQQLALPESYQYTNHNRYLDVLKRHLPISVKDLKNKSPRLATALQDLIVFSSGKDLTEALVESYETKFEKEQFPAKYTTWRSSLQRSVESDTPQFVLNIVASEAFITKLEQIKAKDLFEKINLTSKQSGHPYVENQLGWARLELDPDKQYILVDEIQTDHMNALDRIKHEQYQGTTYTDHIKRRSGMTDEEMNNMISEYKKLIKNFPDVAIAAITKFAKENGFKKIYWHEYESGKNLKRNDPPKSLYTDVPKRHFFEPTEEKPFGLEGKFFGREARMKMFKKVLGSK